MCPGLTVRLVEEASGRREEWCYEQGLGTYLTAALEGAELVPNEPFRGDMEGTHEAAQWAVHWLADDGELVTESYVNLVPTAQGGTHVAGLRQGLADAMREFCDNRNLLPRGVKLAPEDVFERCAYVLSVKLEEPQFSGQTKERLSSRSCAAFVSGIVRDAFSLWLHQHVESGERIAAIAISRAQRRLKAAKVVRKKVTGSGRPCPASWPTARRRIWS